MTTQTPTGSRRRSRASGPPPDPPPVEEPRQTRGFHVIRWIEAHCVFTNGEWIGRPFRLLPWQKQLILELFELEPSRLRRYRWALIGVPKKNGKTELAAALALYFLIGDGEPSPLVVCAAASEDQADLVFGAARTMVELSPTLRLVAEPYDAEIQVPSLPGAKLKRVAAASGTNDGQNIHVVVCDELHEWVGTKGENVWTVLTNGTGARRQPMVLQITTAGYDLTSVLGRQYEWAKAGGDPRYYFHWSAAPEEADYRAEATWAQANPSYGVTVHREFFEDQLKKPESVFRRYFLNQWVATEDNWLPDGAWRACRSTLELDPGRPTYVGIDYAPRRDSTAVVVGQLVGQTLVVRAKIWSNPHRPGTPEHDAWTTNTAEITNHLRWLRDEYPVTTDASDPEHRSGPIFVYDPHQFRDPAKELALEGLLMVEFPQTLPRLVPASWALYERIVERQIAHNGDPLLAAHVGNVTKLQTERGWRMSKPKGSPKHIDAAMALAFLAGSIPTEPAESVYASRGIASL